MSIKVNILKVIKTVEIDKISYLILTMIYGLKGNRPKTVEEVSQETAITRSMIYHRLRKMKNIGLIDENRRIAKIEFTTDME
jgi:predicted transcriptional regulator